MTTMNVGHWDNEKVAFLIRTSQGRNREEETAAQYFEVEQDWLPNVPRGAIMRAQRKGWKSKGRHKTLTERTEPIGDKLVVYDEGVITGFTDEEERPALKQLMADAKAGKVTKVIVVSTDRAGNDLFLMGHIAHVLRRNGALLHDISTGLEVTPLGGDIDVSKLGNHLLMGMYAGAAEISKKSQIEKSIIGTRRARAGGVCSGRMDWILAHDYTVLNSQHEQLARAQADLKEMSRAEKTRTLKAMRKAKTPVSGRDIAFNFNKINKKNEADNKWLVRWRENFAEWREAGVLDEWLSTVEAIQELERIVKKTKEGRAQLQSALSQNSCFLLYPTGTDEKPAGWEPMTREKIIGFANS